MGSGSERYPEQVDVDWAFIAAQEGIRLTAYIPTNKAGKVIGKSGLTISTGFDMGQWSEADFNRLAIDSAHKEILRDRFRPFFKIKGEAALSLLRQYKADHNGSVPEITLAQSESLDAALRLWMVSRIRKRYDDAVVGGPVRFHQLPREAQTAIVSAVFNVGLRIDRVARVFWAAIVQRDWRAAARELRNWSSNPAYPASLQRRRDAEARLFERLL